MTEDDRKLGYIKLYRCLKNKPIWKKSSPAHKVILITILLMANYKPNEWEWQGEKFKVVPGQFVTSLEKIKEVAGTGISIQNVRTAITRFEKKYEFLTNQSTKTGRLITVLNWEEYQSKEDEDNKEPNKQVTKRSQRPNKELTPIKEGKKDKNEKNKNISEFEQAIIDFRDMRKEIKHPLTEKAEEMLRTKLSKMGDERTQIAVLRESILNSWRGVFPLKQDGQAQLQKPQRRIANTGGRDLEKLYGVDIL